MALNCCDEPASKLALVGEIAITVTVTLAAFTVSSVVAFIPFSDTVMVVLPAAKPVTNPDELMLATEEFDELHAADLVISSLLPSLYFPAAENC